MMDGKQAESSESESGGARAPTVEAVAAGRRPRDEDSEGESMGESDSSREPSKKATKVSSASRPSNPKAQSKGTYPKPKNFAERMMNVLENSVYSDIISWSGEQDLVSIDTRKLKQSDILDARFQGIKYAAFVRNLSRWGFRKAPKTDNADGVFVYRNSLFQRDNPHLVRHMKIDSDVQDIFGQHQRSAAQSGQQQMQASQPQPAPLLHQPVPSPSPPVVALRDSSLNLLTQLISHQQQQNQQQQDQANLNMSGQVNNALTQPTGRVPPRRRNADEVLGEIVSLSQEYLDIPSQPENTTIESIKSLLRLVIGLGNDRLRQRDPDGVVPSDRPQQPHPQPQQPQSTSNFVQTQQQPSITQPQQQISASGMPFLQELLLSLGQTRAQTARQQQEPGMAQAGGGPMLHNMQQQAARQPQLQQPPPQQQQQAGGQQMDIQRMLSQAAGVNGAGGMMNPEFLRQLQQMQHIQQQQQQQQQQQNSGTNQPSPPGNSCRQS